jgi:hypothetical protein
MVVFVNQLAKNLPTVYRNYNGRTNRLSDLYMCGYKLTKQPKKLYLTTAAVKLTGEK